MVTLWGQAKRGMGGTENYLDMQLLSVLSMTAQAAIEGQTCRFKCTIWLFQGRLFSKL